MIAPLGVGGVSGLGESVGWADVPKREVGRGRTEGAIKQMPLTIVGFVLFFPGPTFLFSYSPLQEVSDIQTISLDVDANDKRKADVIWCPLNCVGDSLWKSQF